jgi:Protein of unknown function (DUF664)
MRPPAEFPSTRHDNTAPMEHCCRYDGTDVPSVPSPSSRRHRPSQDREAGGILVTGAMFHRGTALVSRSQLSLRWVMTHMIEEYARHNGHADLLRERLDGSTGE